MSNSKQIPRDKEINDLRAQVAELDTVTQLKIENLIADKLQITAQANNDVAMCGQWNCDYTAWHNQVSAEIDVLIQKVEAKANEVE